MNLSKMFCKIYVLKFIDNNDDKDLENTQTKLKRKKQEKNLCQNLTGLKLHEGHAVASSALVLALMPLQKFPMDFMIFQ